MQMYNLIFPNHGVIKRPCFNYQYYSESWQDHEYTKHMLDGKEVVDILNFNSTKIMSKSGWHYFRGIKNSLCLPPFHLTFCTILSETGNIAILHNPICISTGSKFQAVEPAMLKTLLLNLYDALLLTGSCLSAERRVERMKVGNCYQLATSS